MIIEHRKIIEQELALKSLQWMTRHHIRAPWFIIEADKALKRDAVRAITIGGELYLAIFWLGNPVPLKEGHPARYDSSDQLLLHWIVRPDGDRAVHDHPWDFSSHMLSGGYDEVYMTGDRQNKLGLELDSPKLKRTVRSPSSQDEYVSLRKQDAHCITKVERDTWTLVRTGDNQGDHSWGFYPPGKNWVDWKTYLDVNGASADSQ